MNPLLHVPSELTVSALLLLVLFGLLVMYGFHGLLKFGKGVNYVLAIVFALFALLMAIGVVMSAIEYISDDDLKPVHKEKLKHAMLMMAVATLVCALVAFLRYNYSQLYGALNTALPPGQPIYPRRGGKR